MWHPVRDSASGNALKNRFAATPSARSYRSATLLVYGVILVTPFLLRAAAPNLPDGQIPSLYIVALWSLPLFVARGLRNPYNQLLAMAWSLYFVLGMVHVVAAYEYYGAVYRLESDVPAFIYTTFTAVFVTALRLSEAYLPLPGSGNIDQKGAGRPLLAGTGGLFDAVLVLFPFVWLADLYLSLGSLPILSAIQGANIQTTLYSLEYGRLYGFGLINVLGALVVLDKSGGRSPGRWLFRCVLLLFCFIMVAAGKRALIVIFVVAGLAYVARTTRLTLFKAAIAAAVVAVLYGGLVITRQGFNRDAYSSFWVTALTAGDEYKAFAYAVNYFAPGEIDGYDWAVSAAAAGLNSGFLRIFGVDKDQLVRMGSAYTWGQIFSTTSGIRSGIIGETYMAYGYLGYAIVFILGHLTGLVSYRIVATRRKRSLLFLSVVYALLLLTIVGQTTDTVGSLVVVFYAWAVSWLLEFLVPKWPRSRGFRLRRGSTSRDGRVRKNDDHDGGHGRFQPSRDDEAPRCLLDVLGMSGYFESG